MEEQTDHLYFEEEQRMPPRFLVPLLLVLAIPLVTGLMIQFTGPAKVAGAVAASNILLLGSILMIYSMKLTTRLDSAYLRVRFFPFQRRDIALSDISSWVARTYDPIREYGGWGIRGRPANRALNMSGDRGVQLRLTGGEMLLIGSQRAEELASAITLAKMQRR